MKSPVAFSAAVVLSLGAILSRHAQSGGMQGMNMGRSMDSMGKDTTSKGAANKSEGKLHMGTGVVEKIDPAANTVTIAHGPIKSLNWPAMTMTFAVKDKAVFGKFSRDKKVEFEFVKRGSDYVITSAR